MKYFLKIHDSRVWFKNLTILFQFLHNESKFHLGLKKLYIFFCQFYSGVIIFISKVDYHMNLKLDFNYYENDL